MLEGQPQAAQLLANICTLTDGAQEPPWLQILLDSSSFLQWGLVHGIVMCLPKIKEEEKARVSLA